MPAPTVDLAKTPSFRLDGKRALVTGGGRGIGLAAASALARAGAEVTLVARTQSEIEAAARAIVARGDKASAVALDVTDLDAVRRAIAAAEPFDVLINNAGINRPAYLMDVKVEDFDAIFALNVRAAFFMAQAVARRLIEAKRAGSIINVSSQMGHVGAARRTVYCASKHAMEGFTKAMAIELAPEHRAEGHLHVFDLDAECGAQGLQRVDVEAVKLSGRGIAHAEHRRVHRGPDPQHAAVENSLQAVGRLTLRRCRSGGENGGEADEERAEVHHAAPVIRMAVVSAIHSAVQPPSRTNAEPVISEEASEARKTIAPVNSSSWPRRPSLILARTSSRNSLFSKNGRVIGVSRKVGPRLLTRMLWGASSIAIALVKPSMACFEAQ
jgi:NADP-dependent 3-hydroxy acid dehydrogenase YdfG